MPNLEEDEEPSLEEMAAANRKGGKKGASGKSDNGKAGSQSSQTETFSPSLSPTSTLPHPPVQVLTRARATYPEFLSAVWVKHGLAGLEAHIVYQNDKCELVYGSSPLLVHAPLREGDRGPIIGAYALAIFPNSYRRFEWIWAAAYLDVLTKDEPAEDQLKKIAIKALADGLPKGAP